jgi:5-hydroxyisourate hydrolase-like protein (transthyretin family)
MNFRQLARVILGLFLVAVCVSAQSAPQTDKSRIGGTVVNTATGKPEAGVWVTAETKLGVSYRKIVVTDDQGRFLVPDLPAASYDMWVRGYGLKDSAKTKAERGTQATQNGGWKGRRMWTSFNSYSPKFSETKLGYLDHIQYRPNPLAN